MNKLETLTDEQTKTVFETRYFWLNYINSCKNSLDKEKAKIGIDWLYKFSGKKEPIIIYVESPVGCQLAVTYLKEFLKQTNGNPNFLASVGASVRDSVGASVRDSVWDSVGDSVGDSKLEYNTFSAYGNIGDYGWVSFYDFFTKIGVLNNKDFNQFKEILLSGIYDMIQLEGFCIVCGLPKTLNRNVSDQLHSLSGPAISFNDGYALNYINGRKMPDWIFDKFKNNTLSKEDFINEQNEDIKAGIYELIESKEEGAMLTFLGAKEVDKQSFVHANGEIEEMILYKTKETFEAETDLNGKNNVPLTWIKMSCPSTGTNYLIASDSSFDNCVDAAKFARPDYVPKEVDYIWSQRN